MSGLTAEVARLAANPVRMDWPPLERAIDRLAQLARSEVPKDLDGWGRRLLVADGPVPLVGLHAGAATYPGLLWDGARLHRAGLGMLEGLLLLAAVTCDPDAPVEDLARAVGVGLAVDAALRSATAEDALARPTTGTVAAAACVAVARGAEDARTANALALAGALMVVEPTTSDGAVEQSLRAGHTLAAGWLAWQLSGTGVVSMDDAVGHTLATVTGRPLRLLASSRPATGFPAQVGICVRDVVRLLW